MKRKKAHERENYYSRHASERVIMTLTTHKMNYRGINQSEQDKIKSAKYNRDNYSRRPSEEIA